MATIVHCAGNGKGDEHTTRTLVRAAAQAGVRHLVYVSVAGADRVPVTSALDRAMFGYFAMKRAAEQVVAGSGVPWTTLRATQFHDLVLTVVRQLAKLPAMPAPTGQVQPVDTDDVAERLVQLALGEPAGLVPELGGPRSYPFTELVRSYLRAYRRRRLLVPVRLPGRAARAVRAGAITTPDQPTGRRDWEQFLADRVAGARTVSGARGGRSPSSP